MAASIGLHYHVSRTVSLEDTIESLSFDVDLMVLETLVKGVLSNLNTTMAGPEDTNYDKEEEQE